MQGINFHINLLKASFADLKISHLFYDLCKLHEIIANVYNKSCAWCLQFYTNLTNHWIKYSHIIRKLQYSKKCCHLINNLNTRAILVAANNVFKAVLKRSRNAHKWHMRTNCLNLERLQSGFGNTCICMNIWWSD